MQTITPPWESWRAVIAVLREKAVPHILEHADSLEQQLERHGLDEPTVRLSLTDDVYLRSSAWAHWQLGIPLPADWVRTVEREAARGAKRRRRLRCLASLTSPHSPVREKRLGDDGPGAGNPHALRGNCHCPRLRYRVCRVIGLNWHQSPAMRGIENGARNPNLTGQEPSEGGPP
jgi:hypothetical protein